MNLIVDIGNTQTKFAIFENHTLLLNEKITSESFLVNVKDLFKIFPKINNSIISSVKRPGKEVDILSLFCKVHVLSQNSKIPFW